MVSRLKGSLTFLAASMNFCLGASGRGGEGRRIRGVEEAGEYGDSGLAAHDPLSRAGGGGLACGPCAWDAATAAFRNRRSSWRGRDYRWESRRVGALLPLTDGSLR